MKNSALKILSLMTLTFAVACGDDPAAPMIAEIETVLLDGSQELSRTVVEIDYRNGNEVDLVSTYRNGELRERLSYYYDIDNNLVNRIDISSGDSKIQTWLAEYNSDSEISFIRQSGSPRVDGVTLSYANGNLVSQRGPNLNVRYIYNHADQLGTLKTGYNVTDFRWNGDLLTSTRTTTDGWSETVEFDYNEDGAIIAASYDSYRTEIFYDNEGRVHEVINYYGSLSSRSITTYRYTEGTVASVQPNLNFMGGHHFGMDGKPLAQVPMVTLDGFMTDN